MTEIHAYSPDDTLCFKLHTTRTEVQETVQVSLPITLLVQPSQQDQKVLDTQIRTALQNFIAADWVFSTIRREGETLGYERLHLSAKARVSHAEIYNLKERARSAGREGLELGDPRINYKLPSSKVSEVNNAMRLQLLEDVMQQIPLLNHATNREWRIGEVYFGQRRAGNEEGVTRFAKGGYREDSDEDVGSDVGLTGGERFSLIAEVTLRSVKPASNGESVSPN